MNYYIIILGTLAAYRAARVERHAAWPFALAAFLLGLPLLVMDNGMGYLITSGGWFLLALFYVVWRLRMNRALEVEVPPR